MIELRHNLHTIFKPTHKQYRIEVNVVPLSEKSTDVSVALLINEVKHHSEEFHRLEDRIEKVEEKNEMLYNMTVAINSLSNTVSNIDDNVKGLREDVSSEINDIKDCQQRQEERIDEITQTAAKEDRELIKKIRDTAISIIFGGVLVYILSQIAPFIKW